MFCNHGVGESGEQFAVHRRIGGERRLFDAVLRGKFRGREQDGKLGSGESLALASAAKQLVIWRNAFNDAVEAAAALKGFDQADIGGQVPRSAGFRNRKRERLESIILQHQMRNGIGHVSQQLVTYRLFQPPGTHLGIERDLDIHLIIRTIDARAIVDKVGVDPSTAQGKADTTRLRHAQVGALANDLRAHLGTVDSDCVITRVSHLKVALAFILYVRPDTAKPHQLDRRFQDRSHQRSGFEFLCIYAK